jgi:hypothetical protein
MKEEKESEGIFERHQPEEGRDRAPPAVSSFLVDLAIQRNTPRGMVENYVRAFAELHSEGHIDRQLVKLMLYVPWWWGRRKGDWKDESEGEDA